MTKYVRNEFGGVHSVDDETEDAADRTPWDALHSVTPNGTRVLPQGWSQISEAQARKDHPQLFGAVDPTVRMNANELRNARALTDAQADLNPEE